MEQHYLVAKEPTQTLQVVRIECESQYHSKKRGQRIIISDQDQSIVAERLLAVELIKGLDEFAKSTFTQPGWHFDFEIFLEEQVQDTYLMATEISVNGLAITEDKLEALKDYAELLLTKMFDNLDEQSIAQSLPQLAEKMAQNRAHSFVPRVASKLKTQLTFSTGKPPVRLGSLRPQKPDEGAPITSEHQWSCTINAMSKEMGKKFVLVAPQSGKKKKT